MSDSSQWKGKVVLAALMWLVLLAIGAVAWKWIVVPQRASQQEKQARDVAERERQQADQALAALVN